MVSVRFGIRTPEFARLLFGLYINCWQQKCVWPLVLGNGRIALNDFCFNTDTVLVHWCRLSPGYPAAQDRPEGPVAGMPVPLRFRREAQNADCLSSVFPIERAGRRVVAKPFFFSGKKTPA